MDVRMKLRWSELRSTAIAISQTNRLETARSQCSKCKTRFYCDAPCQSKVCATHLVQFVSVSYNPVTLRSLRTGPPATNAPANSSSPLSQTQTPPRPHPTAWSSAQTAPQYPSRILPSFSRTLHITALHTRRPYTATSSGRSIYLSTTRCHACRTTVYQDVRGRFR